MSTPIHRRQRAPRSTDVADTQSDEIIPTQSVEAFARWLAGKQREREQLQAELEDHVAHAELLAAQCVNG